jgi:hypothetical protein
MQKPTVSIVRVIDAIVPV